MLLRCIRDFETRETGVPFTVTKDTIWYKLKYVVVPGGYEDVVLELMDGGAFTGVTTSVRIEKANDLTLFEPVPLRQCPEPVGSPSE